MRQPSSASRRPRAADGVAAADVDRRRQARASAGSRTSARTRAAAAQQLVEQVAADVAGGAGDEDRVGFAHARRHRYLRPRRPADRASSADADRADAVGDVSSRAPSRSPGESQRRRGSGTARGRRPAPDGVRAVAQRDARAARQLAVRDAEQRRASARAAGRRAAVEAGAVPACAMRRAVDGHGSLGRGVVALAPAPSRWSDGAERASCADARCGAPAGDEACRRGPTVVRACRASRRWRPRRGAATTHACGRRGARARRRRGSATCGRASTLPAPRERERRGRARRAGALAPPVGCAAALRSRAARRATATSAAAIGVRVSEPHRCFLRCLRGELTGSRRESSATAGSPADSPPRPLQVRNGSPVRRG